MQSSAFGLFLLCDRYIKTLKHYVWAAGSASFFRQEAPTLLDSMDRAILSHCLPPKPSQVDKNISLLDKNI